MTFARALFALIGLALLFLSSFLRPQGVSLALLGATFLAFAYELPLLASGL